jgi:hypothetical protein
MKTNKRVHKKIKRTHLKGGNSTNNSYSGNLQKEIMGAILETEGKNETEKQRILRNFIKKAAKIIPKTNNRKNKINKALYIIAVAKALGYKGYKGDKVDKTDTSLVDMGARKLLENTRALLQQSMKDVANIAHKANEAFNNSKESKTQSLPNHKEHPIVKQKNFSNNQSNNLPKHEEEAEEPTLQEHEAELPTLPKHEEEAEEPTLPEHLAEEPTLPKHEEEAEGPTLQKKYLYLSEKKCKINDDTNFSNFLIDLTPFLNEYKIEGTELGEAFKTKKLKVPESIHKLKEIYFKGNDLYAAVIHSMFNVYSADKCSYEYNTLEEYYSLDFNLFCKERLLKGYNIKEEYSNAKTLFTEISNKKLSVNEKNLHYFLDSLFNKIILEKEINTNKDKNIDKNIDSFIDQLIKNNLLNFETEKDFYNKIVTFNMILFSIFKKDDFLKKFQYYLFNKKMMGEDQIPVKSNQIVGGFILKKNKTKKKNKINTKS